MSGTVSSSPARARASARRRRAAFAGAGWRVVLAARSADKLDAVAAGSRGRRTASPSPAT